MIFLTIRLYTNNVSQCNFNWKSSIKLFSNWLRPNFWVGTGKLWPILGWSFCNQFKHWDQQARCVMYENCGIEFYSINYEGLPCQAKWQFSWLLWREQHPWFSIPDTVSTMWTSSYLDYVACHGIDIGRLCCQVPLGQLVRQSNCDKHCHNRVFNTKVSLSFCHCLS